MHMQNELVEKTKQHFLNAVKHGKPIGPYLPRHVEEVEKWAIKILKKHNSKKRRKHADMLVTLLGVWLHDFGNTRVYDDTDHAIKSEREAFRFLPKIGVHSDVVQKVAHVVRAHRCKDVRPETAEAKIVAVADSASHMTEIVYVDMLSRGIPKKEVVEKLERDYRDIGLIPGVRKDLAELYRAWRKLISVFPQE